jgi:hypothetical protein
MCKAFVSIKAKMKIFKKISLVYALQIFAVILLFGYVGSTSENKTKDTVTDGITPSEFNKQSLIKTDKDTVMTEKINGLWNINTAKSW